MKKLTIIYLIFLSLLAMSCKDNPERHLKLGNWYYEKGLVQEAIFEYREVIRLSPAVTGEMSREELNMLSKAHFNLAVAYSKNGWYEHAFKEANQTFDLWPSKENYEIVELLKKRRNLDRLNIETGS